MATEAYTTIDDMWRSSAPYIKVNGTWKRPDAIYQKTNESWKLVWEAAAYTTLYFCPYKRYPNVAGDLYGLVSTRNIGRIIGEGYIGYKITNSDDVLTKSGVYTDKDCWRYFYQPTRGNTYTVVFDYPPASGMSGKKVYIHIVSEFGNFSTYEIKDANKINAGSYKLYFNGSTFSIVT